MPTKINGAIKSIIDKCDKVKLKDFNYIKVRLFYFLLDF